MANIGIAPPDYSTELGKLRALIGDVNYSPLTPPQQGKGDYALFSDDELLAYLSAGESAFRGAGLAFLALSAQAAMQSKSTKDYDLAVDLTKRAEDLRKTANEFFARADEEDAGSEDAFWLVPTGDSRPSVHPEAAPWPVRRWC